METYTQGLIIADGIRVRRERRLPVEGQVCVRQDERVRSETIVARAELPGRAEVVNVAGSLGVSAGDLARHALKREGDRVEKGEILARSGGFLGLFKSECASPVSGWVESISTVTGQVVLRGEPLPVDVTAYVDGRVADVFPGEGAAVETTAAFLQGIFGIGGERWGELAVRTRSGEGRLDEEALDETCRGKIVVGGRGVSAGCFGKAEALGIRGFVVGSITDRDLRAILGYDLGSAITGSEAVPATLIITEGFGDVAMAAGTFEFLRSCDGRRGAMNGKTQIRAGVIRPEIIIPSESGERTAEKGEAGGALRVGARVRGSREPFFGRIGTVVALPDEPVELETEARVRVAEIAFDDGIRACIPRSNLEAI